MKGFEVKTSIDIRRQSPSLWGRSWFNVSTRTSTSSRHTVILFGKLIAITIFKYKKGGFKKES